MEVQRATESLHLNLDQMGRIGVDLQNISASLAEAQRSGGVSITNLETMLHLIDDRIDHEIAVAAAKGEDVDVTELKESAFEKTREAVAEVQSVRDSYASELDKSRLEMANEGYTPDAVSDTEGQNESAATGDAHQEADSYGVEERSADQLLVNAAGPWTPAKQAAAGRLRDYATINDATADVDQVRYAGERLDDYRTAQIQGPLPADTVLGGDARSQARTRLDLQQRLEQGILGTSPMPPDRATAMLDQARTDTKNLVVSRVQEQLQQAGMSPEGAAQATASIAEGAIPKELVEGASLAGKPISGATEAFNRTGEALPTGEHWKPGVAFSASDVETLKSIGGKLGAAGSLVDLGVGLYEWQHGTPAPEVIAKTSGGMAGAYAGGALGAEIGVAVGGPPGAFVGALILGTAGAYFGEGASESAYKWIAGD